MTNTAVIHTAAGQGPRAGATTLTVDRAHQLMQEHLPCTTADCADRQAALAVLVDKGHYVLDRNVRRH